MDILLLIVGLVLIIAGANYLTEGASALAAKIGVSDMVIGLTVVAIGTSMPEMVVSVMSAFDGNSDIAIGNVVGSNMFNTLVILGVTALIMPLTLSKGVIRRDIPFGVMASLVLLIITSDMILDGAGRAMISRTDGILLLLFFVIFIIYTLYSSGRTVQKPVSDTNGQAKKRGPKGWLMAVMIVGGLGGLVLGGELFLDSAVSLATSLGLSQSVIAVTLVAGGTSLPELATSITAAVKKNAGIALGNAIGSNISNIFLVLGASAVVNPLTMGGITMGDIVAVLGSSLLLFVTVFTFRKNEIDRAEGAIFLVLYVAYIWWVLAR